ncbi:adenine nucleotide alpha-hydrolase family protein [Geminicoccus roseus]|uniref:potassium ABC transporter ATPase n=1 Tax=Geminicoccus roseus TaxID=404900 RepID=UPI000405E71E|nr:potassium ABC transporter ATPase [Geminicoccus roseus]
MSEHPQTALLQALDRHDDLAIAVSGGVDSMTLAYLTHRFGRHPVRMVHAVSPAVPPAATARVERHAALHGWRLDVVGAGEFDDPSYRANPANRCYFCKTNLYGRIRGLTSGTIASGANLDDLSDYRPGLIAATEHRVVHPYVEAGIAKVGVRALAARHGLDDLAELPAQPCLASRVETGIAIDAGDLAFVDLVERELAALLPKGATLRCRITHAGAVVELDGAGAGGGAVAATHAAGLAQAHGRTFLGVRPYRRGSAFLR